jgi:hypothetical protein
LFASVTLSSFSKVQWEVRLILTKNRNLVLLPYNVPGLWTFKLEMVRDGNLNWIGTFHWHRTRPNHFRAFPFGCSSRRWGAWKLVLSRSPEIDMERADVRKSAICASEYTGTYMFQKITERCSFICGCWLFIMDMHTFMLSWCVQEPGIIFYIYPC